MKRESKAEKPISEQVKQKISRGKNEKKKFDYISPEGNTDLMISTGSTLLDLAISGGRVHGGGIPAGIVVEIFGPSQSGKTVLLSQIAGNVQEQGGEVAFHDPEGRLNRQFAQIFKFELDNAEYDRPNVVPEIFQAVRKWKPKNLNVINGIFADSLAALSTDLEMETDEGDKMGARRAKEFSQEFRRTCRMLVEKNYLMVCSNQIREVINAGQFQERYKSSGGLAMEHYPSLRLRTKFAAKGSKIRKTITQAGKEIKESIGANIEVEVYKSSVWKPQKTAPVTIIWDYGIDDIRQNLQYLKTYTGANSYVLGGETLSRSLSEAIIIVEEDELEDELKEEVINLWEEIETKFKSDRKPRK